MPILSKDKRIIYSRKIKGFWEEYRRNKIGLLGLAMLTLYIIVAIISPYIILHDPETTKELAENYAMPEWVTYIIPAYRNLPRTIITTYSVLNKSQQDSIIKIEETNEYFKISYNGNKTITENLIIAEFDYQYDPPDHFVLLFGVTAKIYGVNITVINIPPKPPTTTIWSSMKIHGEISIITPNGTEYVIYKKTGTQLLAHLEIEPKLPYGANGTYAFTYNFSRPKVYQPSANLLYLLGYARTSADTPKVVREIFSTKGKYKLKLSFTFEPYGIDPGNRTCDIYFFKNDPLGNPLGFIIKGKVYGLLGTDNIGSDVFSQLILGVRISLFIGVIAAILSTSIGVTVGVFSGYIGGFLDEVAMRIVDILLCIPVLPLLLVLITMFGASVWYLILIIALFWWLGLSRVIRSQVLSIREMPFIECAIASGAPKHYIMFRHIVPNVLPVALADFVLTVPGAIILESSLSFIGFGDPNTPTWGRMLSRAWTWGGFATEAWWTYVPPGLAIIFLCLTFVFIGHALDEVVNPRLRKRR
ncbi:MAG: ABC transporter permease [Candidatus Baldrarchaeia archaeon]